MFDGPTDFAYMPVSDARSRVEGAGRDRVALRPGHPARCRPGTSPPPRSPVELRGAGQASRQVNNFCAPDAFECDKLVAVEVLTPGGNWSSYPPHKHDTASAGEAVLEEIYYFEVGRPAALGYQRVYSSERGQIDTLAEVSSGDVVLVPYGYHGPSMAAPGYDLYYLNVLAGPGRASGRWRFCDDPRHAWIRSTWDGQADRPATAASGGPHDRLTVAQAVVRFLAAQWTERDGVEHRLFAGCFGIFGHGNVAGLGQALASTDRGPALPPEPATSRRWCTPPPPTRGPPTGCPPWPAPPRSAPARPT